MTAEAGELEGTPIALESSDVVRQKQYEQLQQRISLLIDGEKDLIAVLATVACELHHAFEYHHWTVCRADRGSLVIGPYQGSHGCVRIPIGRGVCGTAALERRIQLVRNVHEFPGHIACASSTNSEIVVPYFSGGGELLGVLDVDSNELEAFREVDEQGLSSICELFNGWNAFREHV